MGRKASPPAVIRSEGQRLLLAVGGTLGAIAKAVGCSSRQTIAFWKSGEKTPGAEFRAKLAGLYDIPPQTWDHEPEGGVTLPALERLESEPPEPEPVVELEQADEPEPEEPVVELEPLPRKRRRASGSSRDDVDDLIATTKKALSNTKLLTAERLKLNDSLVRSLTLKHRLEERDEMLEDRLVREHPEWQRLKRDVLRALERHPDALREVVAALKKREAG